MNTVTRLTIRFNDGMFFATMEDSDLLSALLEGSGETLPDALRDLAEVIETTTSRTSCAVTGWSGSRTQ